MGKIGLLKKSMCGARDAASNGERNWQGHLESWGYELERSSRNLFHNKKKKTSGLTHGDDFVVSGSKGSCGAQEAAAECVSNQIKHHRGRFDLEHSSVESENMLGRDRNILFISTTLDTSTREWKHSADPNN